MKRILSIFLCLTLILGFCPGQTAYAAAEWPSEISISADGGILMDINSGAVLFEKNSHEPYYPASITKILTALIVIENCGLDETVTFSNTAVNSLEPNSSILGARAGDTLSVRDCLYALLLQSANEVANALAEHCAGSIDAFAEKMNEKAAELGCMDTYFITPNGLDAEDESGVHSTTAEDLAKIMQYCIMTSGEKEAFLEVTRTKEYQFQDTDRKRTFSCHNHNAFLDMMDGALSGKTGFTAEAGYCYVGSLRRDERTFIVALLACGWPDNKGYKWKDTRRLMEYGLEHYHYREVYRNTVPDKLLVVDAFDPEIPYQTSEKISLRVKNSEESKKILLRKEEEIRMEIKTVKCKKAPVKKGEKAGTVSYYLADEKIAENVVVTERAVEKRTWEKCMKIVTAKFLTLESLVWYVKYV